MSSAVPPELLTPETAAAELETVKRGISRAWLVYALVEAVILVPWFGIVIAYKLTDAMSLSTLAVATIIVLGIDGATTLYWVKRRVRPLEERRQALELSAGAEAL